jgi:hypothetical protein
MATNRSDDATDRPRAPAARIAAHWQIGALAAMIAIALIVAFVGV